MHRTSLHNYQEDMASHIIKHQAAAVFAGMGTGKTVATLTALNDMQQFPVLIVAPLLVAKTVWSQEALKWGHVRNLQFSHVLGTATQRGMALCEIADIYIINKENLQWLASQKNLPDFKVIVLDELSGYRKPGGQRVKAVHKLRNRFKPRMVGLTGTPAPNGLLGLFSQIKCLDGGKLLGRSVERFRNEYFIAQDYNQYDWQPRPGTPEALRNLLSVMTIALRTEDYLELPKLMNNQFLIDLPDDIMEKYRAFERTSVLEEGTLEEITAVNNAVLIGKLTQLASGRVYEDPNELGVSTGAYNLYHDEKTRVLKDIIEDMQGEPILVSYWYQHSRSAILDAIPGAVEITPENLDSWNRGEIPVMLIHPASAGHGLNLQFGGHQLAHYDMIYDLELYEQTVARLDRQGQTKPVFNHLLMARNTIDETIYQALKSKSNVQQALLKSLKRKQL